MNQEGEFVVCFFFTFSPRIKVSLKGGCLMAVVKGKVGKHIKVLE